MAKMIEINTLNLLGGEEIEILKLIDANKIAEITPNNGGRGNLLIKMENGTFYYINEDMMHLRDRINN